MHCEPVLVTEKGIGETWIAADRPSTRLGHFDICKSVGRLLKPATLTLAARFAACTKNRKRESHVERRGIAAQELGLSCGLHQLLDLVGILHVQAGRGGLRPAIRSRSDESVADRLVLGLESLLVQQNLVRSRPGEHLRDPAAGEFTVVLQARQIGGDEIGVVAMNEARSPYLLPWSARHCAT